MSSSLALLATGVSTGLVAGGASCAAVQRGLLAGAVTRRSPAPSSSTSAAGALRESRSATEHASAEEPKALVPVGAFLAGKLLSHTLLGALLGVFGNALQPSPRARAVMMIAAAVLMLLFALDLFGVKAVG
ncbi:hypothetical protein ACWD5R_40430 [Streptomyces sp. NPDC002514]|uniref:hypothetical protein n=1 Tax=Streptomyces sp. NPDC001270 TaxID=3364554 RepID=UPI00369A4126